MVPAKISKKMRKQFTKSEATTAKIYKFTTILFLSTWRTSSETSLGSSGSYHLTKGKWDFIRED
ncbi:Hypothetical protein FKW44_019924 [Caligus rogercresseyi]|uniref:Uncharacterized protein n=1 Tax=Caligus rogercresseyi TaxID=217165 RepID=A0A7T8GWI9_CALRO|nr:Hypothetical protein FKW44_019924 [Caligus rogercresseyi]